MNIPSCETIRQILQYQKEKHISYYQESVLQTKGGGKSCKNRDIRCEETHQLSYSYGSIDSISQDVRKRI